MDTVLLVRQLARISETPPPPWQVSENEQEHREAALEFAASRIVLAACAALELGASAIRIDPDQSTVLRARFVEWHTITHYTLDLHPRIVALFRSSPILDVRFDACAAGERVLVQAPRR